ncbi:MAG: hypothetical protein ABIF11_04145 [Nitrospirota bacterium]
MKKLKDDGFTKGLELIKSISFTEKPSLRTFGDTIRKYVNGDVYSVNESYVTSPDATAIYKAFYSPPDDYEHKILFLLFPRQDEKTFKTVYAIGKKIINNWEKSIDASPFFAKMDGKLGSFKNNPFAGLKGKLNEKK